MIDNESGEDYLEAILRLSSQKEDVHSVEVAREIGVSKPAVTKAIRILTQKGYVRVVANHIHLTESGKKYAESVYAKHRMFTAFFMSLGVDAKTAEADACRVEHVLSEETCNAIRNALGSWEAKEILTSEK